MVRWHFSIRILEPNLNNFSEFKKVLNLSNSIQLSMEKDLSVNILSLSRGFLKILFSCPLQPPASRREERR